MNLYLPDTVTLTPEHRSDVLGGITVLTGDGAAAYRAEVGTVASRPAKLTMIPYYAWCHRGANEMAVWLPRSIEKAEVPPEPTIATTARASASHCWQADYIEAVNDGIEPKNSIDHDIPRFTWWDHRGTAEWVQLDLAKATKVSSTAVYWFDDTGRGGCRVPKSWQLLYREDGVWKRVQTTDAYELGRDRFNEVTFDPITTDGLRLQIELQPKFSGGILEWRVD